MIKGSCLCSSVKFEYQGELGKIAMCHCQQCRKAQGSPFACNMPVESSGFNIVQGKALITEYESSPGKKRAFCSKCGSPIYSRRDELPDNVRLRMGTFDTPIDEKPAYHIYATSKAEWWEILDSCHQYEELEPR